MNEKNTRYLEKRILENADRLIECAIAASLMEAEKKEKELSQGVQIIAEIAENLRELIDVRDEHLPEILNQIISQKLPDTKIQKSLGSFSEELDHMLKLGIASLGQVPPEETPHDLAEPSVEDYFETETEEQDSSAEQGFVSEVEAEPVSKELTEQQPPSQETMTFEPVSQIVEPEFPASDPGLQVVEPLDEDTAPEEITEDLPQEPITEEAGRAAIVDEPDAPEQVEEQPPKESVDDAMIGEEQSYLEEEYSYTVADQAEAKTEEGPEPEMVAIEDKLEPETIVTDDEPEPDTSAMDKISTGQGILITDLFERKASEAIKTSKPEQPSFELPLEEDIELDPWAKEQEPEAVPAVAYAPITKPEPVIPKGKPERNLELSLKLIFPGVEVLKKVAIDGITFDYYLPGKQLVIDQGATDEDKELKESLCKQEGLKYVIIEAEDGKNPRRVERLIQWKKVSKK